MQLSGQVPIPAPQQTVWLALFDPAFLRVCIPGCEAVERNADGTYAMIMTVKVGPLNATFGGTITLEDPEYPTAVTLTGSLQSGAAGFAKGHARIALRANGNTTDLEYLAEMRIGGKLAAVGDRLFGSAVKRNIASFFAMLETQLSSATLNRSVPDSVTPLADEPRGT